MFTSRNIFIRSKH